MANPSFEFRQCGPAPVLLPMNGSLGLLSRTCLWNRCLEASAPSPRQNQVDAVQDTYREEVRQ